MTSAQNPEIRYNGLMDNSQMEITPTSKVVDLKPNDIVDGEFTITNNSDEAHEYKIYSSPYYAVGENYSISFDLKNRYTKMAEWIAIKMPSGGYELEGTITVSAKSSETIGYRIAMSADADSYNQYATIMVEQVNKNSSITSGVETISRIGYVIYGLTDKVVEAEPEVQTPSIQSDVTNSSILAGTTVTNGSTTDISAEYTLTVKNIFGKVLHEESKTVSIWPETARNVQAEWTGSPSIGLMTVSYTITSEGITSEQTRTVLKMPVISIITLALLVGVEIASIVMLHKSKKQKRSISKFKK